MRAAAILNHKGGVGKTTTAFNLAHAMARLGYRVLAIDLDPQEHLNACFGYPTSSSSAAEFIANGSINAEDLVAIRNNLYFLPAGQALSSLESAPLKASSDGLRLRNSIRHVSSSFDWIYMDCPPFSGMIALNAVLASTDLIIPVACDYLSLHGVAKLCSTLENIEKLYNSKPEKWLLCTRFFQNRQLSVEVFHKLEEYFPGRVLDTLIRESTVVAESPGFNKPVYEYNKRAPAAADYPRLAAELVARSNGFVAGQTDDSRRLSRIR